MREDPSSVSTQAESKLYIAPTSLIRGEPELPSSKYYTLRYLLAATLAEGESKVSFPAVSDDSDALFRGCRALGAELTWLDEGQQVVLSDRLSEARTQLGKGAYVEAERSGAGKGAYVEAERSGADIASGVGDIASGVGVGGLDFKVLGIRGVGRPQRSEPITIDVGNAGAVLRFLLGIGALLPQVTFTTEYTQSLGKRPNRELLQALTSLGVTCEATGREGYLPITLHGGQLHGGQVTISGARSSQYLSALLFLAPLIGERLDIRVVDELKSQPLVYATLKVLREAGIAVEHDVSLRRFSIVAGQHFQPREYEVPGDYPAAAAMLVACAVATDPASEVRLSRLRSGENDGEALLSALQAMGADLHVDDDIITLRGGRRLRGIEMNGDTAIDCVPVLVAAACFAEGESVFYNVETLHYKESDRINDLCAELRRTGCAVTPREDAIIVQGRPQGVEGGVIVDGHHDHRLLMALAIVGLRSRRGLTLNGVEHVAKSYPRFFAELQRLGELSAS